MNGQRIRRSGVALLGVAALTLAACGVQVNTEAVTTAQLTGARGAATLRSALGRTAKVHTQKMAAEMKLSGMGEDIRMTMTGATDNDAHRGTALVDALAGLDSADAVSALSGDAATGVDIVRRALLTPVKQIAANAGFDGSVVAARVVESPVNSGFNAKSGEYEDLLAAGVIDPVKVTRSALRNAASIAALVLTTETLVVDKPADEDED